MFTKLASRRPPTAGLLDMLLGPHGVDRYTELVDQLWTSASRATVVAVERPTPRSVTLRLHPNRPIATRAGQHLTVTVEIDGRRHNRCYSPAGREGDRDIELTVTRHEGGTVSEYLYRDARPGMVVDLSEPAGDFVLPHPHPGRLMFIAGGSGITPVMSMLRTLAAQRHEGEIAVLYYIRGLQDACYREELESMPGVRALFVCTRGRGGEAVAGLTGHFTDEHLSASMIDPDAVYVCGPPSLVDAVRRHRPDALAESFAPRSFVIPTSAGGGRVTFADSGVVVDDDGRPLLEQAEAAGLSPVNGCRMGICHTCTRRKTRGAVRNLTTGAVCAADDEDIQICVSAPLGDVEIAL